MAVGTAVSTLVHFAFAAFWTGSVLFVAVGVLPAAEGSYALDRVLARLAWVSRASAAVLLLTGGHLLVAGAGVQWGTQRGWLVAAMVGLWFALAGLVEAGVARGDGRLLRVGGGVAALLLVDAGLLLAYPDL